MPSLFRDEEKNKCAPIALISSADYVKEIGYKNDKAIILVREFHQACLVVLTASISKGDR